MKNHQTDDPSRVHMRAFARLQYLHEAISSGRYPSTQDLALYADRNPRTIKRDLKALRDDFKAPLVYDRKRKGFRYDDPGWQLPPARFSEGELLAFFTAHHVMQACGQKPEATLLCNALAKLAAFLPEQVTFNPNTISAALTFEPMPHVSVEPYILQTLTRAALEHRTVFVWYYSQHRNQLTERKLDVLHLHNFANDWYAIAFDHLRQDIRDFHIGRIRHLQETETFFTPPPDWNADAYLRRGFFMMRGGRLTTVSLVFDAYQARWIRERHTFHVDEQREDLPDGSLRLSFPVGSNGLDAVARFCLAYASHCRAEKPAALRRLIRERLQQALSQHQEKSDGTTHTANHE
jgi:predicted DNA-binding transcriptional regulator YafY